MYTVNVLTPNGRRQQVKVTPNTTLLQILEEVCTKHGFKAEEYDLRHHNKVLDVSSMFRFTSLPNNAQLEMTEAVRQRRESEVTLGLQLESGERLTGMFSPSDTVWNVIMTLKPEENKSPNLVVIYMRQEIWGNEKLQTTTLRSLGLTGGRAMLRLLHKSPQELRTQANVTTNLSRVVIPTEKVVRENSKSPESRRKTLSVDPVKKDNPIDVSKTPSSEPTRKETKSPKYPKGSSFDPKENIFQRLLKDEKTRNELLEIRKNLGSTKNNQEEALRGDLQVKSIPESKGRGRNEQNSPKLPTKVERKTHEVCEVNKPIETKEDRNPENRVILLGDRNAVVYNLNSVKPVVFEEEPDDFYDLTLNDAKMLLRDAKQLCADLEDAPLMTAAQRELEKDKKVLSLLNQYKKTVLRIKFPDRTVLQGTFSPLETVSAVEKFVASYLENPRLKFYLYTTPPKVILKSEERLIECECVPCSVLYFGMPPEVTPPTEYLKCDVLEKMSTPSAAALTAYESRGLDKKSAKREEAEKRKWSKNNQDSEPGTSGSGQWERKPQDQDRSSHLKVPKWFKTNK